MPPLRFTESPVFSVIATALGLLAISLGVNALLNPLTVFEPFGLNSAGSDSTLVKVLVSLYGVRNILMGSAVYIAAFAGNRQTLVYMAFACFGVGVGDGLIIWQYIGDGMELHIGSILVLLSIAVLFARG